MSSLTLKFKVTNPPSDAADSASASGASSPTSTAVGEEVRRVKVMDPASMTFADLERRAASSFGAEHKFKFTFVDDEGDVCTLCCTEELQEAISLNGGTKLLISVNFVGLRDPEAAGAPAAAAPGLQSDTPLSFNDLTRALEDAIRAVKSSSDDATGTGPDPLAILASAQAAIARAGFTNVSIEVDGPDGRQPLSIAHVMAVLQNFDPSSALTSSCPGSGGFPFGSINPFAAMFATAAASGGSDGGGSAASSTPPAPEENVKEAASSSASAVPPTGTEVCLRGANGMNLQNDNHHNARCANKNTLSWERIVFSVHDEATKSARTSAQGASKTVYLITSSKTGNNLQCRPNGECRFESRSRALPEQWTVEPAPDGKAFFLVSEHTGRVLQTQPNGVVCCANKNRDSWERFKVVWTAPTASGSSGCNPHLGVQCDGCGKSNFIGDRYKATNVHDYDLCADCFVHRKATLCPNAVFMKMPSPVRVPACPNSFPGNHHRHHNPGPYHHGGGGPRGGFFAGPHGQPHPAHLEMSGGRPQFAGARCGRLGRGNACGQQNQRGGGGGGGRQCRSAGPSPDARFVCDVSLCDGTVVSPGERFVKIWRLRNSGDAPWPEGCNLVYVGPKAAANALKTADATPISVALAPGSEGDVYVDVQAPETPGRYQGYWRVALPDDRKIGQRIWADFVVQPPKGESSSSEDSADDSPAAATDAAVGGTAATFTACLLSTAFGTLKTWLKAQRRALKLSFHAGVITKVQKDQLKRILKNVSDVAKRSPSGNGDALSSSPTRAAFAPLIDSFVSFAGQYGAQLAPLPPLRDGARVKLVVPVVTPSGAAAGGGEPSADAGSDAPLPALRVHLLKNGKFVLSSTDGAVLSADPLNEGGSTSNGSASPSKRGRGGGSLRVDPRTGAVNLNGHAGPAAQWNVESCGDDGDLVRLSNVHGSAAQRGLGELYLALAAPTSAAAGGGVGAAAAAGEEEEDEGRRQQQQPRRVVATTLADATPGMVLSFAVRVLADDEADTFTDSILGGSRCAPAAASPPPVMEAAAAEAPLSSSDINFDGMTADSQQQKDDDAVDDACVQQPLKPTASKTSPSGIVAAQAAAIAAAQEASAKAAAAEAASAAFAAASAAAEAAAAEAAATADAASTAQAADAAAAAAAAHPSMHDDFSDSASDTSEFSLVEAEDDATADGDDPAGAADIVEPPALEDTAAAASSEQEEHALEEDACACDSTTAQCSRQGHRLTRVASCNAAEPPLPPPATQAPPAAAAEEGPAPVPLTPETALCELGFTDAALNAAVLEKFDGNVTIAAANLQAITDRSVELVAMGFDDTAANLRLLLKHDNSLDATVNEILTTSSQN